MTTIRNTTNISQKRTQRTGSLLRSWGETEKAVKPLVTLFFYLLFLHCFFLAMTIIKIVFRTFSERLLESSWRVTMPWDGRSKPSVKSGFF